MELVLIEDVKNHLPQGFDPYRIYSMVVSHKEVGRLVLREGSDEKRYYDGHIGYQVYEEFRGHHYAYEACLLIQKIVTQDHLIITCDPHNIASLKTIEKLGCVYLETKPIPTSLQKFFTKEEKVKNIYRWNIELSK